MPLVELVQTVTDDGVRLDGALSGAQFTAPPRTWLLVHGTGANFYSSGVLAEIASAAADAGDVALRINTRGHDGLTTFRGKAGTIRGGAAFENPLDAPRDLAAWLEFCQARKLPQVIIAGHSLGAVKAIMGAAQLASSQMAAVVALSPPRFCFQNLWNHPAAGPFREDFERARALVDLGQGEQLIEVRQPLPLWITAAGFVNKYGPHDNMDYFQWLSALACPGLIVLAGKAAAHPAFAGQAESLAAGAARWPGLCVENIPGADVPFRGSAGTAVKIVNDWLTRPFNKPV